MKCSSINIYNGINPKEISVFSVNSVVQTQTLDLVFLRFLRASVVKNSTG